MWCLYLVLLALQIHGYRLLGTIGHVAYSCYSTVIRQPSLLTLYMLVTSVSLLLSEFMPILLSLAFLLLGGGF